jgi:D-arginine dehydrogenase
MLRQRSRVSKATPKRYMTAPEPVSYVHLVMSEFLVLGGGMAGASAGYFLAESGSVGVLEMEHALGYHSTGRSAALFSEYYGGRVVRTLTAASRPFLTTPPSGFLPPGSPAPLLAPRGVVALGPAGCEERFEAVLADGLTAPTPVREIDPAQVQRYCPIVVPGWYSRAMLKPAAMDIDVAALHQGFVRGIRARGGQVLTSARVRRLTRQGGLWRAVTDAGEFRAPVVLNAAGAWADEVAGLAGVRQIGLTPRRRTAFLVEPPAGEDISRWPMITDVADTFYFKPESGQLLISPADATPVPPGDVRPDDLDIAVAADLMQARTTLVIRQVRHAWAGLRSSVRDDVPVIGAAPGAPGFFWLAALGGYGIQTAPAAGRLAAALASSAAARRDDCYRALGIEPAELAPDRCHSADRPAA